MAEPLLKDDLVGRQSIVIRLSSALALGPDYLPVVVLVEGSEEALGRAKLLLGPGAVLSMESAEKVRKAIQEQEDDAASGMGLIFG